MVCFFHLIGVWLLGKHILLKVWIRKQILVYLNGCFWLFQVLLLETSFLEHLYEVFGAVFDGKSLSHRIPSCLLLAYKVGRTRDHVSWVAILFSFFFDHFLWLTFQTEIVDQSLELQPII